MNPNFMTSKRVEWMINCIADSLGIKENLIEDHLNSQERNKELLEKFLSCEGPPKIFVYYQIQDQQ